MTDDNKDNLSSELVTHVDNVASATLTGYAEALKRYSELTSKGVDSQLAIIEALKEQHIAEAARYKWLAAQAEAAGDLKSATALFKEADHSAHLVTTLSQQLGSGHRDLQAYVAAREAGLLAKVGGSKAAETIIRKSGSIGKAASLVSALSSGDDVAVTKALAGMAVGGVFGAVVGIGASRFSPSSAPTLAAATSLLVAEMVPHMLNDAQWAALTEIGKTAINAAAEPLAPFWQAFLRSFGGDLEDIAAAANDKFLAAINLIRRIDPLVLDLDGDGIETLGTDAGVLFDFDGDGVKTGTGWIKGDDGFLVLDRNGNGQIDSGAELFGVDTVKRDGTKARNGFDALADLDSNGDGVFDANDEMFSHVRVWQEGRPLNAHDDVRVAARRLHALRALTSD